MPTACRFLSAAVVLSTLAFAPCALARDPVMAETLFQEGRALMDAGNYAAACPKLAESYAQDPATGTLLALALCQEAGGQTASAWASFSEVVARAQASGQKEREDAARERMAALGPKLSRLTINVQGDQAGIAVSRDGTPVGRAAWGTAVPIDPGTHVIEASAPGKVPFRTSVTIAAEKDAQAVGVPILADAPRDAAPVPLGAPAQPARATADVAPESGPPLRTIGIVVGAVGVVGLGVGGFFALRAASLDAESNENGHCDANQQCDPTGGAKRDDAIAAANVATVAVVAGGVLTAAGLSLFLVGGPQETRTAHVSATPVIARDSGGLVVHGAF